MQPAHILSLSVGWTAKFSSIELDTRLLLILKEGETLLPSPAFEMRRHVHSCEKESTSFGNLQLSGVTPNGKARNIDE